MASKPVPFWQLGVVKVIFRMMMHSDFFHHPSRSLVLYCSERDNFPQMQSLKAKTERSQSPLGR